MTPLSVKKAQLDRVNHSETLLFVLHGEKRDGILDLFPELTSILRYIENCSNAPNA